MAEGHGPFSSSFSNTVMSPRLKVENRSLTNKSHGQSQMLRSSTRHGPEIVNLGRPPKTGTVLSATACTGKPLTERQKGRGAAHVRHPDRVHTLGPGRSQDPDRTETNPADLFSPRPIGRRELDDCLKILTLVSLPLQAIQPYVCGDLRISSACVACRTTVRLCCNALTF